MRLFLPNFYLCCGGVVALPCGFISELGVDPDTYEDSPKSARSSMNPVDGELEWDPQGDKAPLSVVRMHSLAWC